MSRTYKVKIAWIPFSDGGRKQPIPNTQKGYYPLVIAGEGQPELTKEQWSVRVEIDEKVSETETLASMTFFSEKAPFDLHSGDGFRLYEGTDLVAHGTVLEVICEEKKNDSMTRKHKIPLWVMIVVFLLAGLLLLGGWAACMTCVCDACFRPNDKNSERAEEMFNAFPRSDNYVLLTNRELVYRGNRIPLDEITYDGRSGCIVYLDQEGFYSYVMDDSELTVTFFYTTYADLIPEELGQIGVPGRLSFDCVFYDGAYNLSLATQTDGEWQNYEYRWSVAEKALVEPYETKPYDTDSLFNCRESDYAIENKPALFYDKVKITEKSTGVEKTISKKVLKSLTEDRKVKRAFSSILFQAKQAYAVGDDLYLVFFFGVDSWGDELYVYVVKWNFQTEESAFFTWVYFDKSPDSVKDFIILE